MTFITSTPCGQDLNTFVGILIYLGDEISQWEEKLGRNKKFANSISVGGRWQAGRGRRFRFDN